MPRKQTQPPEAELDPATADLDELARQVAEAEARAARARAVIAERREQAERRRAEAQHAHDERVLAEYGPNDHELVAAEQEARERFHAALAADPLWGALVEMYAAGYRRRYRHLEASGIAARLGRPGPMPVPNVDVNFEGTIDEAASRVASDEAAEREAERVAAGDWAAAEG